MGDATTGIVRGIIKLIEISNSITLAMEIVHHQSQLWEQRYYKDNSLRTHVD